MSTSGWQALPASTRGSMAMPPAVSAFLSLSMSVSLLRVADADFDGLGLGLLGLGDRGKEDAVLEAGGDAPGVHLGGEAEDLLEAPGFPLLPEDAPRMALLELLAGAVEGQSTLVAADVQVLARDPEHVHGQGIPVLVLVGIDAREG